jgi:hypothetical protein
MVKNSAYIITGLLALLTPLVSLGATIDGSSSVAGLGLNVAVSDVPANATLDLIVLPPYGSEVSLSFTSNSGGEAVIAVAPIHTHSAGTYKLFVEEQTNVSFGSLELEVLPDVFSPNNSSLQIQSEQKTSQGTLYKIVAIARDRFDNFLTDRSIQLTASRNTDVITNTTNSTNNNGEQLFSVKSTQAGAMTISAMDSLSNTQFSKTLTTSVQGSAVAQPTVTQNYQQSYNGYGAPYGYPIMPYPLYPYGGFAPPYQASLLGQVAGTSGPLHDFEVKINGQTGIATVQKGHTIDSMEIIARDAQGVTVESFTGTVDLVSTDAAADMAQSVTFEPNALGRKTLVLCCTFFTEGEQIVQVSSYDNSGNLIEGTIVVIVEDEGNGGGQQGTITITSHQDNEAIASNTITLRGTISRGNGDLLKNGSFVIKGGRNDVPVSTNELGEFSGTLELPNDINTHLLRVEAPDGNAATASITVYVDAEAPLIEGVSFFPELPLTNELVTASFTSEPRLKDVTAVLGELVVTMSERADRPGVYEGTFTQATAGTFEVIFSASDSIGNTTNADTTITFSNPDIAVVDNVRIVPEDGSLIVYYDAHPDDRVTNYQIYIGEEKDNFTDVYKTPALQTEHTIEDLVPGETYYVTVTALSNNLESARSTVVSAEPLGTIFEATPGPQRVDLAWLSSENLNSYARLLLRYGLSKDALTETKVIANGQRAYQIKDLFALEYFFTLSGVAADGTTTLLASTSATPLEVVGVLAGASDPIPNQGSIDVTGPLHSSPTPAPAPEGQENLHAAPGTVDSGSNMWWLYLAIALALLPLTLWRLRFAMATTNNLKTPQTATGHIVRLG